MNTSANPAMVKWFVGHLTTSQEELKDPRLNLVDAKLKGLPPVTVINARLDPLRSDGSKLEDALKAANVPVERRSYEGVTHKFSGMAQSCRRPRRRNSTQGNGCGAASILALPSRKDQ